MAFDFSNTVSQIQSEVSSSINEVGSVLQNSGSQTAGFAPKFNYAASTLDTEKYNVKGMSYPEDLMNNDSYGQNRVLFYINVSTDSRVLKNGSSEVAIVEGVQRDMRGSLIGQNVTNAQAIGAVAVGSGIAGSAVGSLFGLGGGGGLAGAALGGSAAYLAANQESPEGQKREPTFTRPQKRLQAAIALYIPNQLSTRYGVQWGEEDTMAFSALAKGGETLGRILSEEESSKRTGGSAGGIAGDVLQSLAITNAPMGQAMGIAAGLAANPKKEQAFKNVDFRTFTFEYQFAPRSEAEAANVQNIIRAFKYHMHPEYKDTSDFLYIYPSEFDIVYYKGNTENLNIARHTSCVLTEMNVNYTPNGVFTTFPNGMPTQINLTLTFKELMLLTKESIEKYT